MFQRSIFWFRQDLRVYDNRGLEEALKQSKEILPIFILDTNLLPLFFGLTDKKFWFLREALLQLDSEIQKRWGKWLQILYGSPEKLIPELVKKYSIEAIFTNRSYGNYGVLRDKNIQTETNLPFFRISDYLLVEPEKIPQRKVFTPFFRLWKEAIWNTEEREILHIPSFEIEEKKDVTTLIKIEKHPFFTMEFWKSRLYGHISKNYETERNILDIDGTSLLSPYIRFWIFSIRQVYNQAIKVSDVFISELAWREFWQHIAFYFPETKEQEFQERRRHIVWDKDETLFQSWCEGKTGYPIVDAAMHQLLQTNRMHGRARMIVASFLTKDLHIDWRLWEAFFKKHLLDYDENINFGNWQWSASVWADPKPLRIFSPILQSQKFDSRGNYIRKYLPELRHSSLDALHNPLEFSLDYIRPIVDHRKETKIARELYKDRA